MAKKKTEISLQQELENQEEWEMCLQKEGLLIAKADAIDALERYRGKCEPCFLFFGGGKLVAAVRGLNPPELEKNVVDKLKREHEVLRGEIERTEIKDPVLLAQDLAEAAERKRREEEEDVEQEVTLAVLKPDIVSSGRADELVEELKERGIDVLDRQEHVFTTEEAETFYEGVKDKPFYQNLVEFMTSGPSEILICAKGVEGITDELKGLVGPSIYVMDEENPCIRAKYATDYMKNAIHVASSKEEASRELAFFYPDFQTPIIRVRRPRPVVDETDELHGMEGQGGILPPGVQRTVAILRPKAYAQHKDAILERIKEAGFLVAIEKEVQLTKEQAEKFYSEHEGETYFGELTTVMSSGPILALLLAREDAVEAWRNMLGPTDVNEAKKTNPECLRAQFAPEEEVDGKDEESVKPEVEEAEKKEEEDEGEEGEEKKEEGEEKEASVEAAPAKEKADAEKPLVLNLLHGSVNDTEVEKDIGFFFPVEKTVAAIKPDAYANRDEIIEKIKSAGFHVAARKDTQLTEDMAQQLYKDVSDKPFFDELVRHMTSGHTLVMVLTRQDAVAGWRKMMGPTDPDKATDETADSIRATYGRNVLENAVHGSSDIEHAIKTMDLLFVEEDFAPPAIQDVPEENPENDENEAEEAQHAEEGSSPDEPKAEEEAEAAADVPSPVLEDEAPKTDEPAETAEATESAAAEVTPPLPEPEDGKSPRTASPEVGPDEITAADGSAMPSEAPAEDQNQSAHVSEKKKSGNSTRKTSRTSSSKSSRSGSSKSSVSSHGKKCVY